MLRCEACRSYVPANEAVTLPVTTDRRKLFARHLGLDENIFLNLPRYRYLCQGHFNSTDFYRNQFGQITKLRLSAVPRAIPPPAPLPPSPTSSSIRPTSPQVRLQNILRNVRAPQVPSRIFTSHPITQSYNQNFQSQKTLSSNSTLIHSATPSEAPASTVSTQPDLPTVTSLTLPPPSSADDMDYTFDEHEFDDQESEEVPEPKKTRGPYKKSVPHIINLDETEFIPSPATPLVVEEENEYDVLDDERTDMVLISKDRLMELFDSCRVCGSTLGHAKKLRVIGTAGSILYNCSKCNRRRTWATQDTIPGKKVYKGNALLSTAALLTPISFPTLKLLFNLARIGIFGNDRYKLSQRDVVWPVVGSIYNKEIFELKNELKNRESAVNLLMDAQYVSPGFCAMMCKVTAIDAETGYIVGMTTLKKTWAIFDNVSGRMEPEGTLRVLEELQEHGIQIDRVTTDRSTTVMAMMRQHFPNIEHKRDAWHMVKGIKKDLLTEAKKKRAGNLIDFVPGIKNHFWYSISEAKGNGELCRELLLSSLFHIIGIHKWKKENICSQLINFIKRQIGRDKKKLNEFQKKHPSKCSNFFQTLEFKSITQCCHEETVTESDDSDYMDPVGNGYFYVLNKLTAEKFLRDVILLSPDLTTSVVENFHSVATGIYTPKKTYLPYYSYAMHSCLAVLHYNNNERSTKEGNRTVMRTVTYPSKALHGKLITKKVKSKAPIQWKHKIIEQCLEVFEKGEGILENVYDNDDDEVPSEGMSDRLSPAMGMLNEQQMEIDEELEELQANTTDEDADQTSSEEEYAEHV